MKLVIAEKPSVARDIAHVLGANERHDACLVGNGYTVTWAFGHLVTIADPQDMNPAWEKWDLGTLPMLPSPWLYTVLPDKKHQFDAIKKLIHEAELVVAATDAGREGEHIFRLIYEHACGEHAGGKVPVKRLWLSSLTDEAIREGFERLQDSALFDPLAAAAKARAHADWLVGLNATRAYTLRNDEKCTVGRVQTPTLNLIVTRHHEIQGFKPTSYYEIVATLEPGFTAHVVHQNETRIQDLDLAKRILQDLEPVHEATVFSLETKDVRTPPPALFNLLTLQKEANQRWGYTAAQVLERAQALYQESKLISYPRTESRHLSTDMVPPLPKILDALEAVHPDQAHAARAALAGGLQLGKSYVDNAKLTDHHAIIPTPQRPETQHIAVEERNLYDLVVRRFLGIFLPPKLTADTLALFSVGSHTLRAKGSVIKDPGWSVVAQPDTEHADEARHDDGEPTQDLPPLAQGQHVPKREQKLLTKQTRPPRPYTDGTILPAMKAAGGLVDDKDLAAYMKASGLGTSATRGEIIEKLLRTDYLRREKKALLPTEKGIALIGQVHVDLKDPATTARWEQRLKAIEDGEADADSFERDIVALVKDLMPLVMATLPIPKTHLQQGIGLCPLCKQGQVRPTMKSYGCSRYKEGCSFVIWKTIAGKTITEKIAGELLEGGTTKKLIKGFTSKAQKPFDARLRLDENHRVVFVFESRSAG
jgi:DNA topoisomerase III